MDHHTVCGLQGLSPYGSTTDFGLVWVSYHNFFHMYQVGTSVRPMVLAFSIRVIVGWDLV